MQIKQLETQIALLKSQLKMEEEKVERGKQGQYQSELLESEFKAVKEEKTQAKLVNEKLVKEVKSLTEENEELTSNIEALTK